MARADEVEAFFPGPAGPRPLRVVYVSYMHPAVAPGGAQQVAYEMFEASLAAGHDAYLIAALEQDHQDVYGKPGAPIVPMPGVERQYLYFPQFYDYLHLSVGDPRSIRFFRELIARLKPDVVHFHHYHRIGVESIRAARLAAPEAVVSLTLHEMMAICMADGQMVKKPSRDLCHAASPVACNQCFPDLRPEFVMLRAARLKAVLACCDVFVFPSEFIAERYVDWGLPLDKCVVVANGQANPGANLAAPADDDTVADRRRDRSRHSPHVNRFGFFGQLIDNKGVDVILEALLILARESQVPPRGLVVEINGGNRHYASQAFLEKITRLAAEIKKFPNAQIEIRDNGPYDRHQLAQRMAAVDWVLVPSTWWEIFGLVLSEAWMFGRPVIVSAIAALKERVTHGRNGYTFPARDARALAELMASVAGDVGKWQAVNRAIEAPMTDMDMLEGYVGVWEEFGGKRKRSRNDHSRTATRDLNLPSDRIPVQLSK